MTQLIKINSEELLLLHLMYVRRDSDSIMTFDYVCDVFSMVFPLINPIKVFETLKRKGYVTEEKKTSPRGKSVMQDKINPHVGKTAEAIEKIRERRVNHG